MRRLTIAFPENEEWILDTVEMLAARKADPGISLGSIIRGILARELKHLKTKTKRELEIEAMKDSDYQAPLCALSASRFPCAY
jgi:hypothetical protein